MNHKSLRIFSVVVGACGVAVYAALLWTWCLEWRQGGYSAKSFLEQVWFVIDDGLFLSGLPPLMLTTYFLFVRKSPRANLRGLIYVALFIPVHFYVSAATAHSPPTIYLPAQLIELLVAAALIWTWKERDEQSGGPASV